MLRTVVLVARGFSVRPRNAASGCMSLRRGACGRRWRVCRGCGEGPAAVVLEHMPLHFRVRDESEFAKRALMNGHEPLLLVSEPGDDITSPSREASVAVMCMFNGDRPQLVKGVQPVGPTIPGSGHCEWDRPAASRCGNGAPAIVHSVSTSPTWILHCSVIPSRDGAPRSPREGQMTESTARKLRARLGTRPRRRMVFGPSGLCRSF